MKHISGKLTLTSGLVGEQTFSYNKERIRYFPYQPQMQSDSFIHLLADGEFEFMTSCSFTLTLDSCYHFIYVSEGTLTLSIGTSTISSHAGHILFFHADCALFYQIQACKCHFYQAALAGAPLLTFSHLIPQQLLYTPAVSALSCIADNIGKLRSQDCCDTPLQTVLFSKWLNDILTELSSYAANTATRREQVPDYMLEMKALFDNNYNEYYSLEELEQHFDKSRYRLCREFSHYFELPPLQYLNRRRIERAKELLVSTSLPVHEIGSLVGIDNTNHFINLFKRETGATPLVFRQEAPVAISELHYPYIPGDHPQ